jgi:hypothetical protein
MAAHPQCHRLELTRWFRGGANWPSHPFALFAKGWALHKRQSLELMAKSQKPQLNSLGAFSQPLLCRIRENGRFLPFIAGRSNEN